MGAEQALRRYQLSDGKSVRVLGDKVTQALAFKLRENGLYTPQTEAIATIRQLDDAYNISKVFDPKKIDKELFFSTIACWSNLFAFYRRGFERNLDLQIGKRLVWIERERKITEAKPGEIFETGRILAAIFDVPDVPVKLPDGTETSLQKAAGMGTIPIEKLELKTIEDNKQLILYEVSVLSPVIEPKVHDVPRLASWSTSLDEDGIPLNKGNVSFGAGSGTPSARWFPPLKFDNFLEVAQLPNEIQATLKKRGIASEDLGHLGSIGLGPLFYDGRGIVACANWFIQLGVVMTDIDHSGGRRSGPLFLVHY